MDITELTTEDKFNIYNERYMPKEADVTNYVNYLDYSPVVNKKVLDVPTAEDYIGRFKPLNTPPIAANIPILKQPVNRPETDKEFIEGDSSMGLNTIKVDFSKENPTWKQVNMDQLKGLEGISHKMTKLKSVGDKERAIIDSIDASDYDNETKQYLKLLAYRESDFNPKAINRFGYSGLYQFGKSALKAVGIKKDEYMRDIKKQHEAAVKYREQNLRNLDKWIGKVVGGIKMTKNGMAAAAHLGGRGNLDKFLATNGKHNFRDGNGTPISNYLRFFQ